MRQGIQTGFKHDDLRRFGCYFFTLCELAERLRAKTRLPPFSDEDIIDHYDQCIKNQWITTGIRDFNGKKVKVICFIENPVKIMNYLQNNTFFKNITHEKNQPNAEFYPVYFIGNPDHFALGSNGEIVWDSWSPSATERGMSMAETNPFRWLR